MDDPYEAPPSPEIYVDTMNQSPDESLQTDPATRLREMGYIDDNHRPRPRPEPALGVTDLRVDGAGQWREQS